MMPEPTHSPTHLIPEPLTVLSLCQLLIQNYNHTLTSFFLLAFDAIGKLKIEFA